jgi:hypothetical protein
VREAKRSARPAHSRRDAGPAREPTITDNRSVLLSTTRRRRPAAAAPARAFVDADHDALAAAAAFAWAAAASTNARR